MKRLAIALGLLAFGLLGAHFLSQGSNREHAEIRATDASVDTREPGGLRDEGRDATILPQRMPVEAAPASEPVPADREWPGDYSVFGVLFDDSGMPIDEPVRSIHFKDPFGGRLRAELASGGRYRLKAQPGRWQAEAWALGFQKTSVTVAVMRTPQRRDFTLTRIRTVAVHVLAPDGRPLFDALKDLSPHSGDWAPAKHELTVALAGAPHLSLPAVAGADATRPYAHFLRRAYLRDRGLDLPESSIGILELAADEPVTAVLRLGDRDLSSASIPASATNVEFLLAPSELAAGLASIRLTVVDVTSGLQLRQGRVTITGPGAKHRQIPLDGTPIEIRSWPAGQIRLVVNGPEYEVYEQDFTVLPGEVNDLGRIEVQPALWIEGKVLDRSGAPVGGVHLSRALLDERDGSVIVQSRGLFLTYDDGSFRIPVRAGRYLLRVHDQPRQHPMVSRSVLVDASGSSVGGVEIRLHDPVVVTVTARHESAFSRVRVIDEFGLILEDVPFGDGSDRKLRLPQGAHLLEALGANGSVVETHPLNLANEAVTVELTSRPGRRD